jgi:peptide/nickel transport system substrate-binding protein
MQLRTDATFHDGTPFDAAAVVANIERNKTLPESRRKSELPRSKASPPRASMR